MKTTITTIEEAAAVVGRMVYAIEAETGTQRLHRPEPVASAFRTNEGTFILFAGALLSLPVTLDIVTAQPEEHTGALATWEPTVLPALRRAMREHAELDGARIVLEGEVDDAYEVKLVGKGWDRTHKIRRGPLVLDINFDCETLAEMAAIDAVKAREAGGVDMRARALAYGGDVPLVAGEEPSGHPAADVLRYAEQRRADRDLEALPREVEQHAAPTSSERTPLPAGWSWDAKRPCDVIGPGRGWIGVYPGGDIVNMTDAPVPLAIQAALITEAKRLGLPCHEDMPTAPAGYSFDVDAVAVYVKQRGQVMPNGRHEQCYWTDHDNENTDPKRWSGHEDARQWAAYMLGEVAPPLREEGAAS